MNIADCYRLLELPEGASLARVKTAYRRLARRYHPDMNSGDRQAKDKFIELTAAYKQLLSVAPVESEEEEAAPAEPAPAPTPARTPTPVKVTRKSPRIEFVTPLSETEQQLKDISYQQLQQLLKQRKFPRAIALVEALAHRIPQDPEVRQWQAIAYQRWGRQLVKEKQVEKARSYLKKALKTDPHNRSLWAEVERDFQNLEKIY
ncbi:J domain-containing protein [Desertifilum sp. FACHB-1129]|uniref:Molecular chaperone DnaJ n=2 Tax=Desertifilum tharense IPPAS B-1220 TaxID=1781255 RepID=A0A1E5QIS5_9CYAN|nr:MULTISPECIES: J domain-containing protein [Desertifilum]MDA0210175.1 J domain-containing protein [Cyanobacteria bacterium FC1]MBD2313599.1 J domain-containing protein [Desertifilum sp. FACHB-1129]MBD2320580.1 J domain-containing protein [Desertifilum sp. FACHB-866]MBD2330708.1 J domain-containing protein [Desertifilum sp. FACHB-868]OEJ74504.1 molecular chaperone DnaJ [Desertifilum tharense IPPAS B-1220]